MKNKMIKLTGVLLALSSANLYADETYMCGKGGQERVISVVYENQQTKLPCKVTYQKDGLTKTLWNAKNRAGYCEAKAEAFVEKQVGWGWNCRYISENMELGIQASPVKK